ncbi:HesB/IscA family protein [Paenibacillus sp. 481]|uniref:HesB/IscA family protein n=1 Tax=Paenibacillus sp. 481 TaxID=2835869 RepID=UPI001E5F9A07|nr:iron-sulfur cluster assembly accessory protein [Paenibacillus sp. 481]UHA74602.1 iron-sulfur cluster assembly accessory protein [Paenibacillus sp. 481]
MITISELAIEKIQDMIAQEENEGLFLRIGVRPGGCSGFSYGMGFDDEETAEDVNLEVSGMKVVIDKESVPHLSGLVIDYKESGMSGGFTIDNPNAVASCGCGSSFRTAIAEGKAEKCDD